VFNVDMKRSIHSTEDFHQVTQKLANLPHELTEEDVKTFISWYNRAILMGTVDENFEKEAVVAFMKGDVKPMSYALNKLVEKEKKEYSDNVARRMLSNKEPTEKS
jgi:RNA binding exosome subunit